MMIDMYPHHITILSNFKVILFPFKPLKLSSTGKKTLYCHINFHHLHKINIRITLPNSTNPISKRHVTMTMNVQCICTNVNRHNFLYIYIYWQQYFFLYPRRIISGKKHLEILLINKNRHICL